MGVLNVDTFPSKNLRWCLVCVICNSQQFSISYIQTLYNECSHNEDVHLLFCAHLIIFYYIFGSAEHRLYYVYTTFGMLTLCNLCVICYSSSFHSFIFKLYIMGVHTFKMCMGDAGPEQSLVFLIAKIS